MRTGSFIIIVLGILLLQPLLVGVSTPNDFVTQNDYRASKVLAQDAGARLDPGDYTNHVPLLIDGSDDFVSQGWPGSGTPADPYVISGLNITYDIGMILISVVNTNASFVVRDCVLNQLSLEWTVLFENTTAARLEYSTIDAVESGVQCTNANDTVIDHSLISCIDQFPILLQISMNCELTNNEIIGEDILLLSIYSHNMMSSHNLYTGVTNDEGVWMEYCNSTTFSFDTFTDVFYLNFDDCYDVSFTDVIINGAGGIHLTTGDGLEVLRCNFTSNNYYGIYALAVPNVVIEDTYIQAHNQAGIYLENGDNVSISEVMTEHTGGDGTYIENCDNVDVTDCSTFNTGGEGIEIMDSNYISVTNNHIFDIGDNGFQITNCVNGTFVNNFLEDCATHAINLVNAPNWTITDNDVLMANANGIDFGSGLNLVVARNVIETISNGIWITNADNATIVDNHVTEVTNYGLYFSSCELIEVLGNTVDIVLMGIYDTNCDNATIEGNHISGVSQYAMMHESGDYAIIRNNTLTSGPMGGLTLSYSVECEVLDNTFETCGILLGGGFALLEYIHVIEQNTVNGLPIYYEPGLSGQDIVAANYGQVFLVNNTGTLVRDGTLSDATLGVEVAFSYNNEIRNLDTSGNYIGVIFLSAENNTVTNHTHDGAGEFMSVGIYMYLSTNTSIFDSEITNCRGSMSTGILGIGASDLFVNGSRFADNRAGISLMSSNDVLITHNQILDSDIFAIDAQGGGDYFRVLNNDILNATYGIYSWSADNWTIEHNTIMYCSMAGIWMYSGSNYVNISQNIIENNYDGILLDGTSESFITNNTIRWNYGAGVYLDTPTNIEVMYNVFALNLDDNGYDDRSGNFWDNGVDTGNWWHDFIPPAPYRVDANTDDRHAMVYMPTEPIISQPQDIYYAEGSEGNEISWLALDDSLSNWEVSIDGSDWVAEAWNFVDMTVNIDGLEYGAHTVIVTLYDIHMNTVTDTVIVHVYDDTPPTISNTPNTEVYATGSGQTLTWTVSDLHPDTYTLYVDGEEFATGSWTSGELEVSIDGLSEGVRSLSMVIRDIDGNTASDPVDVLVILDEIDPIINSPDDITYLVGATGNSIIWEPEDLNPGSYLVQYNNSLLIEGAWEGSRIVLNVDGLAPGNHRFEITVSDGTDNAVDDTVIVHVLPIIPETTAPPPPADLSGLLMIAAVAGVAVVGVVVIYILYQKKKAT